MKRISIVALGLGLALGATAQELSGEVTIDRTVQPSEREASPLPLLPHIDLPALAPTTLSVSNRGIPTAVTPAVVFSEPTAWNPYSPTAPRGYVAGALGAPLINGSLSAGYRFLNTPATTVGAWLQYATSNYKAASKYWRDHQVGVGVFGSQRFGAVSRLDASIDYTWRRLTLPAWEHYNRVNLQAAWTSKVDALDYGFNAGYNWFGYSYEEELPALPSVKQNHLTLGGKAALPLDELSGVSLGVDFDLLASSKSSNPLDDFKPEDSHTGGLLAFTPTYSYKAEKWGFDLGARIDLSFNEGRFFHIAPNVSAWWRPMNLLAASVKVGGGEHINPIGDLALQGESVNAFTVYGFSHVPLTVDVDVTVGPRQGCYARLFGGWARANDWLMGNAPSSWLRAVDVKGGHFGVELGAAFRRLIKGSATWTMAPSDYEKGYYLWRDRARHVVNLNLEAYPIDRLTVYADWELRACRAAYSVEYFPTPGDLPGMVKVAERHDLNNISDITVGANYSLSEALSVMVRGENLLNRLNRAIDGDPSQSFTFMVGASYRFK